MKHGSLLQTALIFALALVCAIAFVMCTPMPRKKAPAVDKTNEPYDFTKEGTIPPAKAGNIEKEADIEEIAVKDDALDYEEVAPQIDSTFVVVDKTPKQLVMRDGFRVQVFAAGTSVYAEEVRQTVERQFSLPAYVTPVDDMYKVRIGDFTTREEAEKFLVRCREGGYKDAWIVETQVRAASQ